MNALFFTCFLIFWFLNALLGLIVIIELRGFHQNLIELKDLVESLKDKFKDSPGSDRS